MKYTVVGVFEDNDYQRYADVFDAESPRAAEELALMTAEGDLVVAGVFEGELTAVDEDFRQCGSLHATEYGQVSCIEQMGHKGPHYSGSYAATEFRWTR